MNITVDIEGRKQTIDVPDDATPEEIDEIVNAEAGGTVAEPAPVGTETPTMPQKPKKEGYFAGLGKYYTEDIPRAIKGATERTGERFKRILAPTELGYAAQKASGFEGLTGELIEGTAGAPERLARTAGALTGTVGEGSGMLMDIGAKATDRLAGGAIGRALKPIAEGIAKSEPVQKAGEWWGGLGEAQRANIGTTVDLLDALGWKGGDVVEGVGKNVKQSGKKFLGGEMKMKQSLAQRGYGKTIDAKKQNILTNIAKYDLESTTGNFSKMGSKADNLAIQKVRQADEIVKTAAANAEKASYVDDVLASGIDYVDDAAALGKDDQAKAVLEKIADDAIAKKMTGKQTIETLVSFKRRLDPDGNLFKLGPAMNDADNLERGVRKYLYKQAVQKINEIAPDAGKLNREAKELWDIAAVASDAASRIANREGISLTDRMIGVGAGVGAFGSMAAGKPGVGAGAIATGMGTSAAIKALGQGRGASGIIESGKFFEGLGKTGLPSVAGTGAGSIAGRTTVRNMEEEENQAAFERRMAESMGKAFAKKKR